MAIVLPCPVQTYQSCRVRQYWNDLVTTSPMVPTK
jgi:hypothetical protein